MFLVKAIVIIFILPSVSHGLSTLEKQCLADSASTFSLDPCLLHAVLHQEGGTPGEFTHHKNGATDIGRGQINRGGAWAKYLSNIGVSEDSLKNNPCVNILGAAFILSSEIDSVNGDIALGVGNYHRGYSSKVTSTRAKYFVAVSKKYTQLVKVGACY